MSACPVCHRSVSRGVVPGPEWGLTHPACFARVDDISEARERQHGAAVFDADAFDEREAAEHGCSVDGCRRPAKKLGLCEMHRTRMRRGQPLDAPPRYHARAA
jgi:hypothetical protein